MRDLGKLIVDKGFKKLPKVKKIAQSSHTDHEQEQYFAARSYFYRQATSDTAHKSTGIFFTI